MLENLKIENFRGFEYFELQKLGRVNLLVGQNNSGKTSILEAIQLLCSRTNPLFYSILSNRAEYSESNEARRGFKSVEIRHLFYGHEFNLNSQFSISGKNGYNLEKLVVSFEINQNNKSEKRTNNKIYDDNLDKDKDNKALDLKVN